MQDDETGPTVGSCESCGRGDEELTAVRRVYFVAVETDADAEPVIHDADIERWCAACAATYPHAPVSG